MPADPRFVWLCMFSPLTLIDAARATRLWQIDLSIHSNLCGSTHSNSARDT